VSLQRLTRLRLPHVSVFPEFAELNLTGNESVIWSTEARYGRQLLVARGLLVSTQSRVAFLAAVRPKLGRNVHWETERTDIISAADKRWHLPMIGFLRGNRVLVRSQSESASFLVSDPEGAISSLRS
jgi:hypothetical protein